ncbi:MAG: DUF4097 family beta strand repeat-containing protein [Bacteroidota bacterium]
MKTLVVLLFTTLFAFVAVAQEQADKINVPLTDPARAIFLKVGLLSGSITVKGSSIKEVIVEAKIRKTDEGEEDEERSSKKSRAGLKLIQNVSTGLTVEEDDNLVTVGTRNAGGSRTVDLTIQVPANCSMKLTTVNDGNIVVDDITGDLEISNTNGEVDLNRISGSAVAHALNGHVKVTFSKVNPEKSMSFSSLNGDIDVAFPPDIKATMNLKSEQGEIYTDFDIAMEKTSTKVEDNTKGKGKFRVTLEKGMKGKVNGGGSEMQFKNFNGDIYIRKGK